jgi:hypothetical protein
MEFKLEPQALIPWKLMDTNHLRQDLALLDIDYMTLAFDEGFEWCDVSLPQDKALKLVRFLDTPSLSHRIACLFGLVDTERLQSECFRNCIGAVVTDEDLRILGSGFNRKPPYFTHCNTMGCNPERICRATFQPELVALSKLEGPTPTPAIMFSSVTPNLASINLCELHGVSIIVYLATRKFSKLDTPVISFKTVKSGILFLKATLGADE